jgi:integrase
MTREASRASSGATLKSLAPGRFVTLEERPRNGGSLQARRLSTGEIRFYFRYSQVTDEAQGSQKFRKPIGAWDPTAPPRMRAPSTRGLSVAAALERCEALGLLQAERRNSGGLKEVDLEERRAHLRKKAARVELGQRNLKSLLATYIDHLKAQGRRSWTDAAQIFKAHVEGAWPEIAATPAAEVTPDQVLDMLRRLVEDGKGRTANKLRAYLRAAYQCAIDVRTTMSIPITFKAFAVMFNPAAQTRRDPKHDRPDKRPLSVDELRTYWEAIRTIEGFKGACLRLHLLTGGQRVQQLVRLRRDDIREGAITIFDGKGRPGQGGPRPHMLPLLKAAAADLGALESKGEFALSTTEGVRPISATTLTNWAHEAVGESIPAFQLKRVRSGVETLLAANGFSREIRGQLQSHGMTGVQARHYDGHDYMPEKRRALEQLFLALTGKSKAPQTTRYGTPMSSTRSFQAGTLT